MQIRSQSTKGNADGIKEGAIAIIINKNGVSERLWSAF